MQIETLDVRRKKPRKRISRLNVLLTYEERTILERTADERGWSMTDVISDCIRSLDRKSA